MKITEEERNEIIKLRRDGKKQREIAYLLGRSLKPIKRVLKEEGMSSALERTVTCLNCEKNYITEREHTKFCSDSCRVSYNKKNNGSLTKICAWCENPFVTYRKEKCYCNNNCYNRHLDSLPKVEPKPYIPVTKVFRSCSWCCSFFETTEKGDGKFCSERCRNRESSYKLSQKRKEDNLSIKRLCKNCGVEFRSDKNTGTCSDRCARRYWDRNSNNARRERMLRNGEIDNDITLEKLFIKDKGECYICGEACEWEDYSLNKEGYTIVGKKYPSIDHVIPISKGGTHTWRNIKLAHHYCNSLKSDKMLGEMVAGV